MFEEILQWDLYERFDDYNTDYCWVPVGQAFA